MGATGAHDGLCSNRPGRTDAWWANEGHSMKYQRFADYKGYRIGGSCDCGRRFVEKFADD
jgi:hypothetical protein